MKHETTQFFAPATIHHMNARDTIEHAYRAAGLEIPTRVDAISELLAQEPEPHEVAATYANKAIDGNSNPRQLTEEALTAWQRATTVEAFKTIYDRVVDALANERISELRTEANKTLDKPFNKLIKRLEQLSTKLDKTSPLDRNRAFDQGTSTEVRDTEQILTTLGSYVYNTHHALTGNVGKLLALVTVPDTTQQVVARSYLGDDLADTRDPEHQRRDTLRKLFRAAERNLDETIISIARDNWHEVSFALADDTEMQRRADAWHNATTRRVDRNLKSDTLLRIM